MPRASHGHLPCSLVHAALLETSPLCSQTGSFAHLWGPRRRPAHMQARRQRRPRQTPTMMPMTECASKESSGGENTQLMVSYLSQSKISNINDLGGGDREVGSLVFILSCGWHVVG